MAFPVPSASPKQIKLPISSTRLKRPHVYVLVVSEIRSERWGAAHFDGTIYAPGAMIDAGALPSPLVAIECAGPVGAARRTQHRDHLYLLWTYDAKLGEWKELSRALAPDSSWTLVFSDLVRRILHPPPGLVEIISRSQLVANKIMAIIDQSLQQEAESVRKTALSSVYEGVLGRIVDLAS